MYLVSRYVQQTNESTVLTSGDTLLCIGDRGKYQIHCELVVGPRSYLCLFILEGCFVADPSPRVKSGPSKICASANSQEVGPVEIFLECDASPSSYCGSLGTRSVIFCQDDNGQGGPDRQAAGTVQQLIAIKENRTFTGLLSSPSRGDSRGKRRYRT
jgi:hypothetical protein